MDSSLPSNEQMNGRLFDVCEKFNIFKPLGASVDEESSKNSITRLLAIDENKSDVLLLKIRIPKPRSDQVLHRRNLPTYSNQNSNPNNSMSLKDHISRSSTSDPIYNVYPAKVPNFDIKNQFRTVSSYSSHPWFNKTLP